MIQEETKQSHETSQKTEVGRLSPAFRLALLVLFAAGAVALYFGIHSGIQSRVKAAATLETETVEAAVSTVQVIRPSSSSPSEALTLPGNTQAFQSTPIFARVGGYLKKWYFDIGSRVKAGQLLAEIETPELDRQLEQARADIMHAQANVGLAQANYALAQTTAERYTSLFQTQSVAKQDLDNKTGDLAARKATVDSAKATVDSVTANLRRLETMQKFQMVYAPFDGVITSRNVDRGALIDTANTSGKQMFDLAETNRLRVFVNVPQMYTRVINVGAPVGLTVAEAPGRTFAGKVVRRAEIIDPGSRTLLTEVDVDNQKGEILPGSFVTLRFDIGKARSGSVVLPVSTLIFRSEGLQVAVVRDNKATLVPVTMGRDFGNTVELSAGVNINDMVIDNPADSLLAGTEVKVTQTKPSVVVPGTKAPSKAEAKAEAKAEKKAVKKQAKGAK